jgi:hypothetical protein
VRAPASNVEIRPAILEDAARIRDLTRAAYAKWIAAIGREPLPTQVDYQRAVVEHTIDLLTVSGALVGLIETILQPITSGPRMSPSRRNGRGGAMAACY